MLLSAALMIDGNLPVSVTSVTIVDQRFDDLTDTIFAGHHQPLKVWVLCPG